MTWDRVDELIVLRPEGDLREGPTGDEVERALRLFAEQGRRVVLDLAATRQLSARALGILAGACREAERHGGRLGLCGVHANHRWLLGVTRLSLVIELYETEASAIAGLCSRQAVA